mmetsp:Transcript_18950/g.26742  ORF Transcript_18950/g.26742 Transcript_18950/m.26742 type:complete len:206 (+) Transcript_18950:1273-1890(+)
MRHFRASQTRDLVRGRAAYQVGCCSRTIDQSSKSSSSSLYWKLIRGMLPVQFILKQTRYFYKSYSVKPTGYRNHTLIMFATTRINSRQSLLLKSQAFRRLRNKIFASDLMLPFITISHLVSQHVRMTTNPIVIWKLVNTANRCQGMILVVDYIICSSFDIIHSQCIHPCKHLSQGHDTSYRLNLSCHLLTNCNIPVIGREDLCLK